MTTYYGSLRVVRQCGQNRGVTECLLCLHSGSEAAHYCSSRKTLYADGIFSPWRLLHTRPWLGGLVCEISRGNSSPPIPIEVYSEACLETTAMRDHLSWKTTYSRQTVLLFQCNWPCDQRLPVLRDHIYKANGVVFQDGFYCNRDTASAK